MVFGASVAIFAITVWSLTSWHRSSLASLVRPFASHPIVPVEL